MARCIMIWRQQLNSHWKENNSSVLRSSCIKYNKKTFFWWCYVLYLHENENMGLRIFLCLCACPHAWWCFLVHGVFFLHHNISTLNLHMQAQRNSIKLSKQSINSHSNQGTHPHQLNFRNNINFEICTCSIFFISVKSKLSWVSL